MEIDFSSHSTNMQSSDPASRLSRVADRLDTYVCKFELAKDSRAIFTFAYVQITRTLAETLFLSNFERPDWVVSLAEHFAAHYIEALDGWDEVPRNVSPAWQAVFETIELEQTSVLEDLVLAMTAHIVHDLPVSLVEVGISTSSGCSHVFDFHQMNEVLAKDIQPIADGVAKRYAPIFRFIDHLEKRYALVLTNFGFRASRGIAWYNACRLLDPSSQRAAQDSVIRSVEALVRDIRTPPLFSLRLLFWVSRWIAARFRVWPSPSKH
jgi:hypothetical protein